MGLFMAKKEETILAEKWDKILKDTFGKDLELENIQQVGKAGTPDRLGCLLGMHISLEYKTDDGFASKIQLLKLARYHRAKGFTAIICPSNFDMVLDELISLHKTTKRFYGYE